jgi:hypothetical protein
VRVIETEVRLRGRTIVVVAVIALLGAPMVALVVKSEVMEYEEVVMWTSFLAQTFARVGFLGMRGPVGFLIGLLVFIVVAVIAWRILKILLPKTGLEVGWQQVITLLVWLGLFFLFLNMVGIWVWF